MKDKLVTATVAQLAKVKGFNWDTIVGLTSSGKLRNKAYSTTKGEIGVEWDRFDHELRMPTQAVLQRWFRDEHGISVNVAIDETLSWVYTIQSLYPGSSYEGPAFLGKYVYSTYEMALEAGLKEALELI